MAIIGFSELGAGEGSDLFIYFVSSDTVGLTGALGPARSLTHALCQPVRHAGFSEHLYGVPMSFYTKT